MSLDSKRTVSNSGTLKLTLANLTFCENAADFLAYFARWGVCVCVWCNVYRHSPYQFPQSTILSNIWSCWWPHSSSSALRWSSLRCNYYMLFLYALKTEMNLNWIELTIIYVHIQFCRHQNITWLLLSDPLTLPKFGKETPWSIMVIRLHVVMSVN